MKLYYKDVPTFHKAVTHYIVFPVDRNREKESEPCKKSSSSLPQIPVQYLATVGADGKAKCRPFMFLMERGGKLWFGTNNQKTVFAEMQENPYVEVCASTPDFPVDPLGREGGVRGQSRRERSLHEHPSC